MLCDNCAHAPICGKLIAMGPLNVCENYMKTPVRAMWIRECKNRLKCPCCNKGVNTDLSVGFKFCSYCGAELEEQNG